MQLKKKIVDEKVEEKVMKFKTSGGSFIDLCLKSIFRYGIECIL